MLSRIIVDRRRACRFAGGVQDAHEVSRQGGFQLRGQNRPVMPPMNLGSTMRVWLADSFPEPFGPW